MSKEQMAVKPKVSVIMPTYNSVTYLPAAIESLLWQVYRPIEIVVIDDASTDSTGDYLAEVARGPWMRGVELLFLRNETNRGVGHSRNRGLMSSTGDLMAYLDSDDLMLPDGIVRRVDFLRARGAEAVCARRDNYRHCEDGCRRESRQEPFEKDGFGDLTTKRMQFEYLLRNRFSFGNTTLLHTRRVWQTVGRFIEDKALMGLEQYGWQLKLFHHFFVHYLDEVVLLLRRGHRTDHLATRWAESDRIRAFYQKLVPLSLAELGLSESVPKYRLEDV
jgi:glycosyltransferase involved in cell wall biosynthesis